MSTDILFSSKKSLFIKRFPADILVTCRLGEKCQKFPEALWNAETLNHSSKSIYSQKGSCDFNDPSGSVPFIYSSPSWALISACTCLPLLLFGYTEW